MNAARKLAREILSHKWEITHVERGGDQMAQATAGPYTILVMYRSYVYIDHVVVTDEAKTVFQFPYCPHLGGGMWHWYGIKRRVARINRRLDRASTRAFLVRERETRRTTLATARAMTKGDAKR